METLFLLYLYTSKYVALICIKYTRISIPVFFLLPPVCTQVSLYYVVLICIKYARISISLLFLLPLRLTPVWPFLQSLRPSHTLSPSPPPCPPPCHWPTPTSDTLFSGSSDMTVKVWKLDTFKVDMSFQAHEDPVCTLTGNDTYLFSGSLKSIKVSMYIRKLMML